MLIVVLKQFEIIAKAIINMKKIYYRNWNLERYTMKINITDYEDYLFNHYKNHGIDTSLFMKLVEEVGEVAEVLNKRDGRKASINEDLKSQLANELVDVIHYAFAIASLNQINLNDVILEKDKKASIKYHHERNLEQFMSER